MTDQLALTGDDHELIAAFAGCSLDEKPGSNWVQDVGGLPDYICRIARAIRKTGKSVSQAIAIAVSRVKKWAAGGDNVDADTRAKAAKAVAQWEAKKAKAKGDNKKVAASYVDDSGLSDAELLRMVEWTHPCYVSATDQILLSILPRMTPLEQIRALRHTGD